MPLPLFLGIGAAIAAAGGVGAGVHGAVKMKEANNTMKYAQERHEQNIKKFEEKSKNTNQCMDTLGKLELTVLKDFDKFSDTIEKIQNRPQFKEYSKDGVTLPTYDKEELNTVSVGAGVLLGGLGGAALGTAGGFAAAGATTAAVMALGTASTGTAIASLSGAALTNATLAAIGGGAIAAGGGGIALGTTILGATTLGVGLLVGGVIFSVTGSKLSDKADEAWSQMRQAEKTIDTTCNYLSDLYCIAKKYTKALNTVKSQYDKSFDYMSYIVNKLEKTDWDLFTEKEKLTVQNTVLLVGLLYKMCQVKLVLKTDEDNGINTINSQEINESIKHSESILNDITVQDPQQIEPEPKLSALDTRSLAYGAIYYYLTQDYNKMITLPLYSGKQLSTPLANELVKLQQMSPMLLGDLKVYFTGLTKECAKALLKQVVSLLESQSAVSEAMKSKIKDIEAYIATIKPTV